MERNRRLRNSTALLFLIYTCKHKHDRGVGKIRIGAMVSSLWSMGWRQRRQDDNMNRNNYRKCGMDETAKGIKCKVKEWP